LDISFHQGRINAHGVMGVFCNVITAPHFF